MRFARRRSAAAVLLASLAAAACRDTLTAPATQRSTAGRVLRDGSAGAPYVEDDGTTLEAATGCDPSSAQVYLRCPLAPLADSTRQTVLSEARRLQQSPSDTCRRLGQYMEQHIGDFRTTPYDFSSPPPVHRVGGDSHTAEPAPGAGTMHIAVGNDSINPWKGWPAVLELYRHEAAHLAFNIPQTSDAFGNDDAKYVANYCGVQRMTFD